MTPPSRLAGTRPDYRVESFEQRRTPVEPGTDLSASWELVGQRLTVRTLDPRRCPVDERRALRGRRIPTRAAVRARSPPYSCARMCTLLAARSCGPLQGGSRGAASATRGSWQRGLTRPCPGFRCVSNRASGQRIVATVVVANATAQALIRVGAAGPLDPWVLIRRNRPRGQLPPDPVSFLGQHDFLAQAECGERACNTAEPAAHNQDVRLALTRHRDLGAP